jgi:hypothetical protein
VRSSISYILAAALVALVMEVIAPPAGFGFAVGARPPVDGSARPQIVDRVHKGDRLQFPAASGRRNMPAGKPAMLTGCEPVFSSLSSGARANYAGRCVA